LAYIVKNEVLLISSFKGIERERDETGTTAVDALGRTKVTLGKLNEPVSMSFANATSLADVLTYIKQSKAASNNGIVIFVDPLGLQEAKRSLTSTVSIDLDGVPLKTTLKLILKQLGQAYTVKEGRLIISSAESIRKPKDRADGNEHAIFELR
jgi:hypothetical protein